MISIFLANFLFLPQCSGTFFLWTGQPLNFSNIYIAQNERTARQCLFQMATLWLRVNSKVRTTLHDLEILGIPIYRAVFLMSVESNFVIALFLQYDALWLAQKNSRHFLNQWEVKPKTSRDVFSCTWRRQHVFATTFDWFIGLPASVLI